MMIAAIALAACSGRTPPTPPIPPAPAQASWQQSAKLGVQIEAPGDAKLQETANHAFVGNATFKLNLFVVDEYSPASAEAQKAQLEQLPGFVKLTTEQHQGDTWRFDYALERGEAGTISRIHAGRALDCGVHGVTPEIAAAVGAACAAIKPL
jgi:hypothetical protein